MVTTEISSNTDEKLNRYDAMPLYIQLKNIILEKISSEEWASGTMIPSENELSRIYGISRMTVRSVITQLATEGLLYRIQGKGTFVSDNKIEISGLHYVGMRSQLEEMGHEVTTSLLSCEKVPADTYISKKLEIAPGDEVFDIRRVRAANNTNISYHKSYVPVRLCPGLEQLDLISEQLCTTISNTYGLQRHRVTETLESYIADESKAAHLNVYPGFPLILLQDKIYNENDIIFEYTRIYFRGDKIKVRVEYH